MYTQAQINVVIILLKFVLGIMAHTLNPSTWESEAHGCESGVRRSGSSRPHTARTKTDGVSDKGQHRVEACKNRPWVAWISFQEKQVT